jgi:DNA-directed RNA polymerase subunit RPC12/RpoP
MNLPIVETPKYKINLPSSNEEIEFRPFLVKEEKILMIAQESEDQRQVMTAISSVIESCLFNKIKIETLPLYDIEYLFTQIRAKSVGESVDLVIKCPHCGHHHDYTVNLSEVKVKFPEEKADNNIKLSETVGIKLKDISIDNVLSIESNDLISTISSLIDFIYDEDNVYKKEETSVEDLRKFIENLPHTCLDKIKQFIDSQPTLHYDINFKCVSCSKDVNHKISGLSDFFI